MPEQIKQGGWCCLLSWLFLFRFGVFLFLKSVVPVHSVPIQSNNFTYHSGASLPGLHKGLQPGSRQGCPRDSPGFFEKSAQERRKDLEWSRWRSGENSCFLHHSAAASGGPYCEPSEGAFYARCCCCLSLSRFRLCWVSFSKLTHLTLRVHLSPPSYAINSLLSCIVRCLALGTALHNELLRKALSFLKTQPQRHVIYVCLQGRWLWMASQGAVSALPGFSFPVYSQDVMTVTVTCNYVDFFPM